MRNKHMYYNQDTFIYHNGKFLKAQDALMDLFSQTLHYGYGVFEGIRSYKTATGETKIFKEIQNLLYKNCGITVNVE